MDFGRNSTLLRWFVVPTAILFAISTRSTAVPAVVLNLKNYGWQEPTQVQHQNINKPTIAVDHRGRVIAGFTIRERMGLVTRSEPSLTFHILRFSQDGKVDLSESLPTNATARTGVYLSDRDQIIARANDKLQMLQMGQTPGEAIWSTVAACPLHCYIEQSSTRRTLVLYRDTADVPLTVIHLGPHPIVEQCSEETFTDAGDKIKYYPQSVTDQFAYFTVDRDTYRWPICDYKSRVALTVRLWGRYQVLNDSLFAIGTTNGKDHFDRRLKIMSSDGRVDFEPSMRKHESWVSLRSGERSNVIAVAIFMWKGHNRILDISGSVTVGRVTVYDIQAATELASVPVAPKSPSLDFDLSPDGRQLAIMENGIVTLIDLSGR